MEAFRFGFTFPIQKKAATISEKALGLPITVPTTIKVKVPKKYRLLKRRRSRCVRTVLVPPPAKKMKMYTPPSFEIEITNMFELLDM
jgi:hypothetical protein